MEGREFAEIRKRLGLSEARFAELLGYTGRGKNNRSRIQEYERGKKQIPLYIARLAWLIGEIHDDCEMNPPEMWHAFVDEDGNIEWPEWPEHGEQDDGSGTEPGR